MPDLTYVSNAICDHCKCDGAYFIEDDLYLCDDCMEVLLAMEEDIEYFDDMTGWFV